MTKTATPWGPATLVERLALPQRAGDKRFSSVVELLETARGERLVRFAYSTGGAARRGPVDAFFDKGLVNSDVPAERDNRLRLLHQVQASMGKVADFGLVTG